MAPVWYFYGMRGRTEEKLKTGSRRQRSGTNLGVGIPMIVYHWVSGFKRPCRCLLRVQNGLRLWFHIEDRCVIRSSSF